MAVFFHLSVPWRELTICLMAAAIFCSSTGCAQENQGQSIANDVLCFNNKFIYAGCAEAYRLNPTGYLNVPPDAVDFFCNGPCLTETELLLDCIDRMMSNFLFYNKATAPQIRNAINAGCTYSKQRGNFNLGDYIQQETGSAYKLQTSFSFSVSAICMTGLLVGALTG